MSNISGRPDSGGRPSQRAKRFPHPGGQVCLPAGFDGVAEYEKAHPPLRREAEGAPEQDRLYGHGVEQQQRAAAVAVAVGGASAEAAWDELVAGERRRFIAAYLTHLSF